jgi:predicted DNA-binding protein
MSKVLESLDLRTRLDNLYESLTDNNGMSKAIVEKYIGFIGTHSDYNILVGICNEMKQYDWLAPVDEFIKESYKFAEDNQLSFAVLNTLESIRTSKDKASFSAAINALEEIKDLNENDLSKNIPAKLR